MYIFRQKTKKAPCGGASFLPAELINFTPFLRAFLFTFLWTPEEY